LRLEYDYDSQSRRIRTSTFTSSGAGSPATRTLFVFDGWRCVAELDALSGNQPIRKYTWGLDLVGDASDSSTGNVGALLWLVDTATSKTHVHLFARNGNVSGLVDATSRNRSATYDYDAFGQLTVCYGDYSRKNPFTFSTKFTEFSTGLCYYGYRWYSPLFGRWLSRDPIGERGGVNLLGFVGNNGLLWTDYLGLDSFSYRGPSGWERIVWLGKDMFTIAFEEASEAGARAAAVEATMSQGGSCSVVAKANGLLMFAGDLSGLLNIVELAPGIDGEFIVASDGLIGQRQFTGIGDELLHAGGGILKFELLVVGARGMKPKVRMKVQNVSPDGRQVYNVTDDFSEVVSSGRVWGQTEGSVYGMGSANAPRWRTMADPPVRDPGTIIFEGQAASLFKPHPIEGVYSGMKRLLGQQKAGFGDIVFDPSTSILRGNTLIIQNATLGPHAGQTSLQAARRLWGRRLLLDAPITAGTGYAGYLGYQLFFAE
jgi:RHS repeat-associated protein